MKKSILIIALIFLFSGCFGTTSIEPFSFSEGDYYVKAKVIEEQAYCLTNNGIFLEYNFEDKNYTIIDEEVKDFFVYDSGHYLVLYNNGTLKNSATGTEYLFPEAEHLGETFLSLKDGNIFYNDTINNSWVKLEKKADKVITNQIAAIILNNNKLQLFDYNTNEIIKIDDDVTDFVYYSGDELYYCPDLLYITSGGKLNIVSILDFGNKEFIYKPSAFTEEVSAIYAVSKGNYIIKTANNDYVFGNIENNVEPFVLPIDTSNISMFGTSFIAIDKENPQILYYCSDAINGKVITIGS